MKNETTLVYIEKNDSFLMLHRTKKENDMSNGKWLAIGGHLEEGETPQECAIREVFEETGLIVHSLEYRAKLWFINDDYRELMHLFITKDFDGELIECNEGDLEWIKKEDILSLNIWEGDKDFTEIMLNNPGLYFEMDLFYSNDKFIKSVRTK